jgi:trehalose 6-phosphate synthase
MNLVAKEYVASQDPTDPGVLVLSCFAGAADQMRTALIVNPFDEEEMAEAIRAALHMPRDERISRWQALMDGVRTHDVHAWWQSFMAELMMIPDAQTSHPCGAGGPAAAPTSQVRDAG